MKIQLHDRFSVTVTPETRQERIDAARVKRLSPVDDTYVPFITGEIPDVTFQAHQSATEGGGGWRRTTVTSDYIRPYWDDLCRMFGARRADLDLGAFLDLDGRIGPTYLAEEMRYSAELDLVQWTIVHEVFPYVGEVFPDDIAVQARAEKQAIRKLQGLLGCSKVEPEFIPYGDHGLYRRNPNYGRGQFTYLPEVCSHRLWKWLCHWWRDNQATPGQLKLLERATEYWDEISHRHSGFDYDNFNSRMSWEEFQKVQ